MEIQELLTVWGIQAVVAAVLSLPVVLLGRHRVRWRWWELLALVLPIWIWMGLVNCVPGALHPGGWVSKGIDNALGEPFLISFSVPVAAIIRVIFGRGSEVDPAWPAAIVLAALCLTAALIFFLTPNLGGSLG
jgi:steroid 5-alpha reductase family enzyme